MFGVENCEGMLVVKLIVVSSGKSFGKINSKGRLIRSSGLCPSNCIQPLEVYAENDNVTIPLLQDSKPSIVGLAL